MAVAEAPAVEPSAADLAKLGEFPYDFAIVDLSETFVDHRYQRRLTSLAGKIAANPNPALFGTIVLSRRTGDKNSPLGPNGETLAAVDGQTRRSGALTAGIPALPAVVYENLSPQDEAELFELLQKERRAMMTHERFKASLMAKNPEALAINKILRKYGLEAGPKGEGKFQAIVAAERVYRGKNGPNVLQHTIEVLSSAWGEEHKQEAFSEQLISGLARFLRDYGDVDENRLTDRLARTTPSAIRIQASHLRAGKGGGNVTQYTAEVIFGLYNARK